MARHLTSMKEIGADISSKHKNENGLSPELSICSSYSQSESESIESSEVSISSKSSENVLRVVKEDSLKFDKSKGRGLSS